MQLFCPFLEKEQFLLLKLCMLQNDVGLFFTQFFGLGELTLALLVGLGLLFRFDFSLLLRFDFSFSLLLNFDFLLHFRPALWVTVVLFCSSPT